jgi:mercuric ion transport protein
MVRTVPTRSITTMNDGTRADTITGRKSASETAATLLVAGGLVSAFGAASCCALPVLLGSLGLASAWLGSLAIIAGPHRPELLVAAVVCLVAGSGVLLWRRRAGAACAPGAPCGQSTPTVLLVGALALGAGLTVLGFVFA